MYEMTIESGLEGRGALVEMSSTELMGQKTNASNISAPTLGKIPKKLSSNWNSIYMGREWLARQAVLSRPNGPKDFQMVMPFVSKDDNADDDIWVKSISSDD